MARNAQQYLEVGDRLLRRGKLKHAATCYVRGADAFLGETFLNVARACVESDPLRALDALARAERLVGATDDGRWLTAQAYLGLGQAQIAANFLRARGAVEPAGARA
ncbi:MAG: hypothetical protein M9894_11805 [Planctomycetes bacterium]|nr:hypothetical protein [Planctomycetota bacterium]